MENLSGETGQTGEKRVLFGMHLHELQEFVSSLRFPKYTASQIADWLYRKQVGSVDEMLNLSVERREILRRSTVMGLYAPAEVQVSSDGTRKYLFSTSLDKTVEAVYIPETDRAALCVSSQVGCRMACAFCMTGRQHFQGHLLAGDILNQIRMLPERDSLTNIVYMGMGEPFDNADEVLKSIDVLTAPWGFGMASRRITVSTVGVIPEIRKYMAMSKCHLAVSLHNPFDAERERLMPAQRRYPISEVIALLKTYEFDNQRRLSFEYILFAGWNDTPAHARKLAALIKGLRCRVNLIRFHPIPDSPLRGSSDEAVYAFQRDLQHQGVLTTVRHSRGQDIMAACGMLSTLKKQVR